MMLINGKACSSVSALDRGLQFGDGLFETVAVRDARPLEWERHLKRLREGCVRLKIAAPDDALLSTEASEVIERADRAVLKLVVTRGAGARGYRPAQDMEPTRILSAHPWPEYPQSYYRQGIVARTCETRLSRNPRLAGLKHLNRLEQVLARSEWGDGYQEGLMLDTADQVVEGTMSNVFLVTGGELLTPGLDQAGVAGIMRAKLLELAKDLGMGCREQRVDLTDVYAAEGVFFCNSLIGLWPVRQLDEKRFTIPTLVLRLSEALGDDYIR